MVYKVLSSQLDLNYAAVVFFLYYQYCRCSTYQMCCCVEYTCSTLIVMSSGATGILLLHPAMYELYFQIRRILEQSHQAFIV